MVNAVIQGRKLPLCLTVAALDDLAARDVRLADVAGLLDAKKVGSVDELASNTTWLLGVLVREGEENRLVTEAFATGGGDRRRVPTGEELAHLMTPAQALGYRVCVMQAIAESMTQDVEAAHEKNGESAGQA